MLKNGPKWLLSVYKFTILTVLVCGFFCVCVCFVFFLIVAQSPDHHLQREGRNILKLEHAVLLHRAGVWGGCYRN